MNHLLTTPFLFSAIFSTETINNINENSDIVFLKYFFTKIQRKKKKHLLLKQKILILRFKSVSIIHFENFIIFFLLKKKDHLCRRPIT